MNETTSLKLHKSHKILCFIVCFVIISIFTVFPCFAVNNVTITGPFCSTGTLNSNGVYEYDFAHPYNIDSGTSVTFPCFGTISFDDSTMSFERLTIGVQGDIVLIAIGSTDIGDVPIFTSNNLNNSSVFNSSTRCLDITELIVDEYTASYLSNFFDFTPAYDGNPWADILEGVIEALDVKIFGTFSYLDIVSTLAGACLAIWLLKMLAGG